MFSLGTILLEWDPLDTQITLTAALVAMACAVPGCYLLLRRQSLLGDALTHSLLPGVVLSFLGVNALVEAGMLDVNQAAALRHPALILGAVAAGLLTAFLSESLTAGGRVEPGAALGVVYTGLFALGLLLLRLFADQVDLDPGCVLFGSLEARAIDTVTSWSIPRDAVLGAVLLATNLGLVRWFYQELRLATFDPELAQTMGIPVRWINYSLTMVTAATLVAAFQAVGSILAVAMLVVPAAIARLMTDRLDRMLGLSVLFAGLSAMLGHAAAITIPAWVATRIGAPQVQAVSSSGMIAVVAGGLFVLATLLAPRYGMLSRGLDRLRWRIRIVAEDILALLYRLEERAHRIHVPPATLDQIAARGAWPVWRTRLMAWWLQRTQCLRLQRDGTWELTERGREKGRNLVRSHRLWEAFLAKHFQVPESELHASAEYVEHYLEERLRTEIAADLDHPSADPHGRVIPPE